MKRQIIIIVSVSTVLLICATAPVLADGTETVYVDSLPDNIQGNSTDTASTFATTLGEKSPYVIVAKKNVSQRQVSQLRSNGASVENVYENLVRVRIPPANRRSYSEMNWVKRVRKPIRPTTQNVGGEGAVAIGANELHTAGVTGKNATVVVIDQGFDPDHPQISENVIESRGFGVSVNEKPNHGTASAEMVLDVAPDANLYLAAVETSIGYRNALDWAVQENADVVTMSLGFLSQPNDGTGSVSQKANEAVDQGEFVFTTSTGNEAQSHWQGDYKDSDSDDNLEFAQQDAEINYLNSDSQEASQVSAGTSMRAVLNWDDWPTAGSNYNLHIVRVSQPGGQPQYVASADENSKWSNPTKRLIHTAAQDAYYGVVVEQTEGNSENLELFTSSDLQYRTTESSVVSPAVASRTIGVGAVRYDTLNIEPYSSRGPTNSGAQGVDFLAPTCATSAVYSGPYCGTSGAAPHAGGAAALLRSGYGLNRTASENLLTETADPIPAAPQVAGSGVINLTRASGSVSGSSEFFEVSIQSTNSPVVEGDSLTVTALVTNTGDGSGMQTVIGQALGLSWSSDMPVSLGSDESTHREFNISTETGDSGQYTVSINSENDTTSVDVIVQAPTGTGTDNPFLNANREAKNVQQTLTLLAEWSRTGGENGGEINGESVSVQKLLTYLGKWSNVR